MATASPNVFEIPTYWFAVMEDSKDRGDFETAARAKRELERLGIHVNYRKPRASGSTPSKVEVCHAS